MWNTRYDVVIVGAGIAGCSLAHALSTLPREKPLRIALLERSLAEPDRIVGEILQPGGISALKELGLQSCLNDIDAVRVKGYTVITGTKTVTIPYPDASEGRSFHHGKFIMKLRDVARRSTGVDLIEANVTEMLRCDFDNKVIGVRAVRKDGAASEGGKKETFLADLVVVADGCFSNFRTSIMGSEAGHATTRSHFVGLVLEDAPLPLQEHGAAVLVKGSSYVLLYQISKHCTRMLVDVKQPIPSDLKSYILEKIVPQLPVPLRCPVKDALGKDRLCRMPNSFLPAVQQGNSSLPAGVILLGDSWNMRHPVTGGGMTVALNDVVILRSLLGSIPDFRDWERTRRLFRRWHWRRKSLASTVNILSFALYDLFAAEDENLSILQTGMLKYFERGGNCLRGPASLFAIIAPSPVLLARHFFAIAFYSIWVMFTHPSATLGLNGKPRYVAPSPSEYPQLLLRSIKILRTASAVFFPLAWAEIRWWAPQEAPPNSMAGPFVVPVTMQVFTAWFAFWCLLLWTFFFVDY
ncbi:squalene epoxidase-domain-containing protein [Mycena rebaudengoi]|nr:squalene epoxidase-domain-containing protein [Mycena rebaudengoi]